VKSISNWGFWKRIRIKLSDINLFENLKLKLEKQKLNEIIDQIIKGILLRTKAKWVEGSERKSKYFANLGENEAEQKIISQLKDN